MLEWGYDSWTCKDKANIKIANSVNKTHVHTESIHIKKINGLSLNALFSCQSLLLWRMIRFFWNALKIRLRNLWTNFSRKKRASIYFYWCYILWTISNIHTLEDVAFTATYLLWVKIIWTESPPPRNDIIIMLPSIAPKGDTLRNLVDGAKKVFGEKHTVGWGH